MTPDFSVGVRDSINGLASYAVYWAEQGKHDIFVEIDENEKSETPLKFKRKNGTDFAMDAKGNALFGALADEKRGQRMIAKLLRKVQRRRSQRRDIVIVGRRLEDGTEIAMPRHALEVGDTAVSYTHLTLPTICSV